MNKKILIVLGLTISLCILIFGVGFAVSFVMVDDLGCDDLSYKWYSACDGDHGMDTASSVPSGGSSEFDFDGTPGFKSVMVGTSDQHTSFNANLFGGAVLTIIWTPGYSSVEQLQVTFDGITKNGRVITATNGSNSQSDARLGDPGNLWYFTEVFDFDQVSGYSHDLVIRSVNGDGVGFDYIKLETPLPIDIKPGSYPNSVNINEHGVIPVAILGGPHFDVSDIDPSTLAFEGLTVRTKGNGSTQCSIKDVSGANMPDGAPDGYDDLVCQFVDGDGYLLTGSGNATVTGSLYDGTPFEGTDSINLVNK